MSFTSGPFSRHAQQVLAEDRQGVPLNTRRAYSNKALEFIEFCEAVYSASSSAGIACTTVTEEKLFGFLNYQSRRPQRTRGRKTKPRNECQASEAAGSGTDSGTGLFDYSEYCHYMRDPSLIADRPCGYSVVNQYRSAIMDLHQEQVDNGGNNVTKQELMSNRVRKLLNNVCKRKIHLAKKNFEEKLTSEFAPYASVADLPRLEDFLFKKNSSSITFSTSSLRDRYCLLMTINGILRGESLFKCELSDLLDLVHTPKNCSQPILILVMRIAIGKTNGLKVLYGRCIRHKDVTQCAIGALGLYLLSRFASSGEGDHMNFASNAEWFNIKLLTDARGKSNSVSVSDQAYARTIKMACKKLNIPSRHFVHFGRSVGSVKAELDELDGYNIADLGNWNVDTRRDVYSAKLPMVAMRSMAGHSKDHGTIFLPRDLIQPPAELQKQLFSFIEPALQSLEGKSAPTARTFLAMLNHLRSVIFQDVAAMMAIGRSHVLFELPVFTSPLFLVFKDQMKWHLKDVEDPVDPTIEQILPGVCDRFSSLQSEMASNFNRLHDSVANLASTVATPQHIEAVMRHVGEFSFAPGLRDDRLEDRRNQDVGAVAVANAENESDSTVPNYVLYKHHKTCTSIWNEWFGLDSFDHSTNGSTFPGGIKGLEDKYRSRWRKSFSSGLSKHISRVKLTVEHVAEIIHRTGKTHVETLQLLDEMCEKNGLSTVTAIESFLKQYKQSNIA